MRLEPAVSPVPSGSAARPSAFIALCDTPCGEPAAKRGTVLLHFATPFQRAGRKARKVVQPVIPVEPSRESRDPVEPKWMPLSPGGRLPFFQRRNPQRPQAKQMTDRINQIGPVQRVEVERPYAFIDELHGLLGGNRCRHQMRRLHVVLDAFEAPR